MHCIYCISEIEGDKKKCLIHHKYVAILKFKVLDSGAGLMCLTHLFVCCLFSFYTVC